MKEILKKVEIKRGAIQENQGNLYSTRPERKGMNVFCFYLERKAESLTHKRKKQ